MRQCGMSTWMMLCPLRLRGFRLVVVRLDEEFDRAVEEAMKSANQQH
jgi:hypothetical protein